MPEGETPGAAAVATDVSLRVDGTPELVIQAEKSTWTLSEGKAVFTGSVVATRGTLVLRCDTLEVEHAEAGDIRIAVALGNVEIEREAWRATGGRATLDQEKGSLVLTESALLEEGGNRLVGERIRVFLESEQVECERCTLSLGTP